MQIPTRPSPLKLLFYAVIDVAGVVLFASGLMWLIRGQHLLFTDFPTGTPGAVAAVSFGLFLMIGAAAQILRLLLGSVAHKLKNDR